MAANPDAPTSSAHQLSCSSQCLDFSSFPPHILHLDMHHLLPEWPLKLPHQLRVFGPHPLPSAAMSNPFPPASREIYGAGLGSQVSRVPAGPTSSLLWCPLQPRFAPGQRCYFPTICIVQPMSLLLLSAYLARRFLFGSSVISSTPLTF